MPAKTEKQKKFFGAVMGAKKGQQNVSGEAKKVAKKLPKREIKKFLKKEDEEDEQSLGTVPMKPDWMNKSKDKFQARKSAKELGKNPTRKTAKQIRDEEDNEEKSCWEGYTKKGTKMKGNKKVNNCVKENTEASNIRKFIEAILTKNYSSANNHLKQVVETKLAKRIQSELNTPLF